MLSGKSMKRAPVPSGPPRVLLLFDSVLQLTALSAMLTANGFRVSAASDLAHARAFAENAQFDLAIVDLADGGPDRVALLALVRDQGARTVAVTGPESAHVDPGVSDCVEAKPLAANHLLLAVRTLLSEPRRGR